MIIDLNIKASELCKGLNFEGMVMILLRVSYAKFMDIKSLGLYSGHHDE